MTGAAGRPASSDRSFERLYRLHVEDVYRYALGVLANRSDAEDVTQTTFLNAYRSYRDGTLPAKPLNWLITIAHNVCRQRFRSAARRPREVALDPQLSAASEDQVEGFRAQDIQRALAALTFTQRSALAMRELEGRSYREIAAMLDLSESAVETLIFRARKAFREQLEGTMTCTEAELAISRQLDGALGRGERGALRSHLRECEECSVLARRFRAQRSAFKRLVLLPLPQSLASFTGGGSGAAVGALGGGIGLKALAIGSAAIVAAGVTAGELVTHSGTHPAKSPPAARVAQPGQAIRATPIASVTAGPTRTSAVRLETQPSAATRGVQHKLRSAVVVPVKARKRAHRSVHAASGPPAWSAAAAAATASGPSTVHGKSADAPASAAVHAKKPKATAPKEQPKTKPSGTTAHSTPQDHPGGGAGTKPQSPGTSGQDHSPPATVPADPGPPPDVPAAAADQGPPADTPGASNGHSDSTNHGKSGR
jgi:RNA polymerase sigma factor (sigma-70 family)